MLAGVLRDRRVILDAELVVWAAMESRTSTRSEAAWVFAECGHSPPLAKGAQQC